MGRRIVVKGADFSANAVVVKNPTWYMGYTDAQLIGDRNVSTADYWYIKGDDITSHSLVDKVVEYVKIYAKQAGILSIASVSTSGNGSIIFSNSYTVIQGINVIKLIRNITLTSSNSIGFSGNGIVPLWNSGNYGFTFGCVGYNTTYGTKKLPVDFGAIE